jgi:hypothetical protein
MAWTTDHGPHTTYPKVSEILPSLFFQAAFFNNLAKHCEKREQK